MGSGASVVAGHSIACDHEATAEEAPQRPPLSRASTAKITRNRLEALGMSKTQIDFAESALAEHVAQGGSLEEISLKQLKECGLGSFSAGVLALLREPGVVPGLDRQLRDHAQAREPHLLQETIPREALQLKTTVNGDNCSRPEREGFIHFPAHERSSSGLSLGVPSNCETHSGNEWEDLDTHNETADTLQDGELPPDVLQLPAHISLRQEGPAPRESAEAVPMDHYMSRTELKGLADRMRKGVTICNRRPRLRVYKKCFVGKDAVNWLVEFGGCRDRLEAVIIGNMLQKVGCFNHVNLNSNFKDSSKLFYRFAEEQYELCNKDTDSCDTIRRERIVLARENSSRDLRDALSPHLGSFNSRSTSLTVISPSLPSSRCNSQSLSQNMILAGMQRNHSAVSLPEQLQDPNEMAALESKVYNRQSRARKRNSDKREGSRTPNSHFSPENSQVSLNSALERSDCPQCGYNSKEDTTFMLRKLQRVKKGAWRLGQQIGSGSFGTVYKGMNEETGQLMAVKVMMIPGTNTSDGSKKLDAKTEKELDAIEQEVGLMRRLHHPNIVQYLGVEHSYTEGALSIFLEWVPGGSLRDILDDFGPLKEGIVRDYARQVLKGLSYLHSNSIIHRDIKSGNVLIHETGHIKLTDFGASKMLQEADVQAEQTMKGTPYFMAPEVVTTGMYGRKADLWSFGGLIIEMISSQPPWSCLGITTAIKIYQTLLNTEDTPPIPEEASEGARHFMGRCLVRDQDCRATVQELMMDPFVNYSTAETDELKSRVNQEEEDEEIEATNFAYNLRQYPIYGGARRGRSCNSP